MKYILRTLWLIIGVPVFIIMSICFVMMIIIYTLAGAFYFIKTGSCENIPFSVDVISEAIRNRYFKLLKHIEDVH